MKGLGTTAALVLAAWVAVAAAEERPERWLSVRGEGTVRARPDIAVADLGVTARGETVSEAMAQSRRRMAAVLEALAGAGIAEADVLTADFSVFAATPQPVRRAQEGEGEDEEEGEEEERFVVHNLVHVTIRAIDRAGAVLDGAIDAGANEVRGIRFSLAEDGDLADRARALAAADAKHRAQQLAQLHGARLGRVLRISDWGVRSMRPDAIVLESAASASPTVSAGELTLAASLEVVYELTD